MPDIFISYARPDQPRVRLIAEALGAEGYDVWWDPAPDPRESLRPEVVEALKAAECVIVVWSRVSVDDNLINEEAHDALDRGVLVVLLVDDVWPEVTESFKALPAVNLIGWHGTRDDAEWLSLLTRVRRYVPGPSREPRPYPKTSRQLRIAGPATVALVLVALVCGGFLFVLPRWPLQTNARSATQQEPLSQPSTGAAATGSDSIGKATPPAGAAKTPRSPVAGSRAAAKQAMEDAANGGNAKAEYALALGYKNGGDDLAADPAKALDWMTKAANQGLAVAQRTLGSWYEQGDGVAKDLAKARAWYERSAQNGDVQAMHNLGFFYAEGEGGLTKNAAQAEKWFKSAAEKGLTDSQVNLAILYSQGNTFGIKPQMDKAYLWASIASERRPSDADAKKMRDVIAGALSAEDKAKIDKEVAAWKPQPVDIVANGGFDTNAQAFLPADRQPTLSRSDVATIQDNLNKFGFSAGTADGRIGPQTVAAIKKFQAAYNLPQTGEANGDLLAALGAVPR
jgi:hypothetical protein